MSPGNGGARQVAHRGALGGHFGRHLARQELAGAPSDAAVSFTTLSEKPSTLSIPAPGPMRQQPLSPGRYCDGVRLNSSRAICDGGFQAHDVDARHV